MSLLVDLLVGIVAALGIVAGVLVAMGWFLSTPPWRGPASDHFNGLRFRNDASMVHAGLRDVGRWMATRKPIPWGRPRDVPPGPRPVERVEGSRLRATLVNHTTVLLQTHGLNILTDPIWSERCGPVPGVGPRRVRPPGIRFEDLPPIDVVLLSHNHYDHCDLRTLKRLARGHHPRVVVPLGCRAFLEGKGIPIFAELDWWDGVDLGNEVRVTAVPARHFSGRGLFDRDRSLWAGYVIATPAGNTFFAGDTGFGHHFEAIRDRFGQPRLALLPIGAFRPEWFMSRVHMSPDEALRAHAIVGARLSLATHFGTFRLADDGETEAAERIAAFDSARPAGETRFVVPSFGEAIEVKGGSPRMPEIP